MARVSPYPNLTIVEIVEELFPGREFFDVYDQYEAMSSKEKAKLMQKHYHRLTKLNSEKYA